MENLIIEATEENSFTSPSINFSAETGLCQIGGESFMNNSYEFYHPLIEWIENYTADVSRKIKFIFSITYYNTSSSKSLFELLDTLKCFEENGGELYIEWHYDINDEEMGDDITDLALSAEVDITLMPI